MTHPRTLDVVTMLKVCFWLLGSVSLPLHMAGPTGPIQWVALSHGAPTPSSKRWFPDPTPIEPGEDGVKPGTATLDAGVAKRA